MDTGAGRSCIREAEYIKWKLPKVKETHLVLASSATGTPITIVGWAKSNVKLGNEEYPHTFLVLTLMAPMVTIVILANIPVTAQIYRTHSLKACVNEQLRPSIV